MKKLLVLGIGTLLAFAFATVEAQQRADPDRGGVPTAVAGIGDQIEATFDENAHPLTHLEPRNINLSSNDWNSIRDSVLLKVQGLNANAGSTQAFAVVACDRASFDDTAHISLMRTGTPREVVTSTNDSAASQGTGNVARTNPRARLEGQNETLFAVLTAPHLNGVIDAGWQIGSGGYRTLRVTILDTFNADGSAPVVSFTIGCGVTLFPF
jgi:hypothetical protein